MQTQRAHIIVRIAALLIGLIALAALALLARAANLPESPDFHGMRPVLVVLAILPFILLWAAVQAWQFRSRGIVTIGSGWALFGIGGTITHLFWFFSDWKPKDAVFAVMWVLVFCFGVLVSRLERSVANDVA